MNLGFITQFFQMLKLQRKNSLPKTSETIKALVDAIVPKNYEPTEKQELIQSFGALDLQTDNYLIWVLNHQISLFFVKKKFNIYLANATAEMLNVAAKQLIARGGNTKPINTDITPKEGMFAALETFDRFRAISFLEQLQVDVASLPVPFRNNPGFVLAITRVITLLAIKGYYTEWSAYGSTRLETPEKRKIGDFPIGWKQVGYPGPSKGYHALRGYLVDKFIE